MRWAQEKHAVEIAAEWVAPALLAAAFAWSGLRWGLPFPGIAALVVTAFAAARFAMRKTDSNRLPDIPAFEPAQVERDANDALPDEVEDVLLLDDPLLDVDQDILLLDDPLTEPDAESRVVRLFARSEPTPGELVDRIADFLGEGRRPPPAAQPTVVEHQMVDASAALHAALANIRASLR